MKASLLNMVAIISVSIATSLIYPLTAQATIAVVIDSPSGKLKGLAASSNPTLNRSAAIWFFIYIYAFRGRARLALR